MGSESKACPWCGKGTIVIGSHADETQKFISSLQSQLESEKAKYEMQLKLIGELNAKNAELKGLSTVMAVEIGTLTVKLKTAEDALAEMRHSRDFWKGCN